MKLHFLCSIVYLALAVRLSALPFGIASEYDVIVKNDFTIHGGHVHGSTAVGGNLVLAGGFDEFGNHLGFVPATTVLTVAGNVVLNASGRVQGPHGANIGSLTAGQSVENYNGGLALQQDHHRLEAKTINVGPVGVDFGAAFDEFSVLSQSLAGLASTVDLISITSGDTQNKTLNLGFPTSASHDVLNLSLTDFLGFKNIQVASPGAGAGSWIINVDLTGYDGAAIAQNRNGADVGADLILWNFYGTSSLVLENQFYGTIFAPDLALTHANNDLKGQVIASSFTKLGGQVHIHSYDGEIPTAPDTGSTLGLMLGAMTALVGMCAKLRRTAGWVSMH